jgi:hypothetical protein
MTKGRVFTIRILCAGLGTSLLCAGDLSHYRYNSSSRWTSSNAEGQPTKVFKPSRQAACKLAMSPE